MKKAIITSLILICACCLFGSRFSVFAKADSVSPIEIETKLELPKSNLEYKQLDSPLDVWTDGTVFVIAERNRIVYYDGTNFTDISMTSYSISRVYKKDNFILFLSSSNLYTYNISTQEILDTGINTASDFSIYQNTIAVNPSSEILFYYITNSSTEFKTEPLVSKKISLDYTPSCLCLISEDTLLYMHEGDLVKRTQSGSETITNGIPNARSISFGENYVYISSVSGIHKISSTSGIKYEFIEASGTNNLSTLGSPRGIIFVNQKLYIADDLLNAITEYNIATSTFSNFKITANHTAVGRISANTTSIIATESDIYTLDATSIETISLSNGNYSSISLKNYYGAKIFASTNNTFLISDSTNIHLVKQSNGEFVEQEIKTDTSQFKNINAISVFENDYYFINNETIGNEQRAVIYKLETESGKITSHYSFLGRGDAICCDLFGDIYVVIYDVSTGTYSVCATDISASTKKQFYKTTTPIISIAVDYEGNLFSLLDSNIVVRTKNDASVSYKLKISQNLPQSQSAIDFALTQNSSKIYFLFKGFVLSCDGDDIGVSSLKKISVPSGFSIQINSSPTYLTIKNGAKLFEVSLASAPNFGEFFDYEHMSANSDVTTQFVLIATTERYSLIANAKTVAIVRTEDTVNQTAQVSTETSTAYLVNDCHVYKLPIIANYTQSSELEKNTELKVLNNITFNGINYSFVESGLIKGYVATSMLKPGIALQIYPETYESYTLTSSTAAYSDQSLSVEISKLSKGTIVNVVDKSNGICKIAINGSFYYISEQAIQPKGPVVIRNVLVIFLLSISIFATSLYFVIKFFSSKKFKR